MNKGISALQERLQKREFEREKQNLWKKCQLKHGPSSEDKEKLQMYFRYRSSTLTKLAEEKMGSNGAGSKANRVKKVGLSVSSQNQQKTQQEINLNDV